MPPSAVVDASVLVSAFLFPASLPGFVLAGARRNAFTLHTSPILIEETRRSLLKPRLVDRYGHGEADVVRWCHELTVYGQVFARDLPPLTSGCRDPDDDHVIATAVAVSATHIVTGDRDLLDLGAFGAIRIVSARMFLDVLDHAAE